MNLAITAAEALAERLGPRAGLVAFRNLLGGIRDPSERARVLVGALDCASKAHDAQGLKWAIHQWGQLDLGPQVDAIRGVLARWARTSGQTEHALSLLEVELRRAPSAEAYFLLGRFAEDGANARAAFRRCLEHAPDGPLADRARVGLARRGEPAAADSVSKLEALPERDRLVVLARHLDASSRYRRVAALEALGELARSRDPKVKNAAYALIARRADRDPLPIEEDRIRRALRSHLRRARVDVAMAVRAGLRGPLPEAAPADASRALASARAVLERGNAGPPPPVPSVNWRARVAVAALRRDDDATEAYRELLEALRRHPRARITEPILTAAFLGRRRPGVAGQAVARYAEQVAAEIVSRAPAARRGYLRLADGVADKRVAEALRALALRADEPGARARRGADVRMRAWQAFRAGESEATAKLIAEARALLEGVEAVEPTGASGGPYRG